MLRKNRDIGYGRRVDTTVPLKQTLVGRSEEREPVEKVLVIDFDAFKEAGSRITRGDQAEKHAVHIHLVAVRRSAAAEPTAVREGRIDRRVDGEDVARKAVGN